MTMPNSSGFEPSPDKPTEEPMGLVVIAATVVLAFLSSGLELLGRFGLPVPHFVTMLIGVALGLVFGIWATRTLSKQKSD